MAFETLYQLYFSISCKRYMANAVSITRAQLSEEITVLREKNIGTNDAVDDLVILNNSSRRCTYPFLYPLNGQYHISLSLSPSKPLYVSGL